MALFPQTMRPLPQLEKCPNEIVECIVVLLSLEDIGHLRLSSRTLHSKATQDHFKSFLKHKHVDLTEKSLQTFISLTQPGRIGCLVEELTLIGVVNNTQPLEDIVSRKNKPVVHHNGPMRVVTKVNCSEEEVAQAQQDLEVLRQRHMDNAAFIKSGRAVALLSQAFQNLAVNGRHIPLRNLKLDVRVYLQDSTTRLPPQQGGSWQRIWSCAAQTLSVAMAALAQSRLPLHEFDLYSEVPRCAVARDQLARLDFSAAGVKEAFASLEALSISASHPVINEMEQAPLGDGNARGSVSNDEQVRLVNREMDALCAEAARDENFVGLGDMLKVCEGSVKRLDIHGYALSQIVLRPRNMCDEKVLQVAMQKAKLRALEGVRLRGLRVREEDLSAFLRQSGSLRQVVLEEMHMSEGQWTPVFEMLTATKLELLIVNDLFEGGKLLYFDGEATNEPKFPTLDGATGANAFLRRGMEDVQREVRYHFARDRPIGSPQAWRWHEGRRLAYGPP